MISFCGVWDGENNDLVYEGLSKSHVQWNMDVLDLGFHGCCLFGMNMVLKLTRGSLWGSQGAHGGVLEACLDFVDFCRFSSDPED